MVIMPIFRTGVKFLGSLTVIVTVVFFAHRPSVAEAETPVQVVENLQVALAEVMKEADNLGYNGRYQKLAKVIPEVYDFPFIARVVLGRYWSVFSAEEQTRFLDLFTRFSIATYAARFDGYSGEHFEIVSANETQRGRTIVQTVLVMSNGERTEMAYVLHQTDNQWKIINVIVDGVSDLSLKRSDYTAFLTKKSPAALLEDLRTKISDLSNH